MNGGALGTILDRSWTYTVYSPVPPGKGRADAASGETEPVANAMKGDHDASGGRANAETRYSSRTRASRAGPRWNLRVQHRADDESTTSHEGTRVEARAGDGRQGRDGRDGSCGRVRRYGRSDRVGGPSAANQRHLPRPAPTMIVQMSFVPPHHHRMLTARRDAIPSSFSCAIHARSRQCSVAVQPHRPRPRSASGRHARPHLVLPPFLAHRPV